MRSGYTACSMLGKANFLNAELMLHVLQKPVWPKIKIFQTVHKRGGKRAKIWQGGLRHLVPVV